jgi:hypothetical protein
MLFVLGSFLDVKKWAAVVFFLGIWALEQISWDSGEAKRINKEQNGSVAMAIRG